MNANDLLSLFFSQKPCEEFLKAAAKKATIQATALAGSSASLLVAGTIRSQGGLHVLILEDRDAAGYLYNDLSPYFTEQELLFFPTAYKRSIQFGQEDPSGIVQRTAALGAMQTFSNGTLVLCTYPEALAEKVVGREQLSESSLEITVGETLSTGFVEEVLRENGFERVEFVYEPGQYSLRGGIVDVFSFADNRPYRLDFFGDEVDSIRYFEVGSQLSVEKLERARIVPNLKEQARERVSFARYATGATYWFTDAEYTLKRFDDIRSRILGELEDPRTIDEQVTSRKAFLEDTAEARFLLLHSALAARPSESLITFDTSPQPSFNKKFELLGEDIRTRREMGYTTCLLTENKAQIERLQNIFHSMGERDLSFEPVETTLHQGFIDHTLRRCFYTDHQLFERYQRYRIRGEIDRSESLSVQELNALQIGDYVVHIDHGVGRFGGLTRTVENGKVHEAIKLVYRDGDVLLVNVHALHRISKYKDKESEPPKIYKLGSGAWQRLKQNTKKAVKDIARELIALYARRKSAEGFPFSADTFMQHELEASFIYEDTPDQQSATASVKADMESPMPMDRLVCGDVGFGKTEIAIRAAFKAVADSKQVAVLVPTTILALQHYRTFNDRLKEFPVRIEQLSRVKSAAETRHLLGELAEGKIDILIGTHKILGKDVSFKDLGLLIIDEEQKFGVAAKEKLRQMRVAVDTLTLTATPIPRTLQFSLMGSRDLSVISTPPPNRQPVATESHLFDEELIREAVDFELSRGGQVYFVHNRVEDIERIASLVQSLCPAARVAVGHGRMAGPQLEKLMMDFIYGEYDVLVATTIIESGVDVPNANTIIINNAQRFGLSDLHQLRGRVGRSNRKAYCYLLSPPEELLASDARRRLRAIEDFSELGAGFNIAMQDLDIRGAGNLLGGEQSGFIADIGFETYQKILTEAMAELREEEHASGAPQAPAAGTSPLPEAAWITDAQIETDREAFIPDAYIGSPAEKLRLYRELDGTADEESLDRFRSQLIDRFGEIPTPTEELFDIVRLRWLCISLGFEKAIVKNGILILQFVHNPQSAYYKSDRFGKILAVCSQRGSKFIFRQNNNKLSVVVRNMKDVAAATATLRTLAQATL